MESWSKDPSSRLWLALATARAVTAIAAPSNNEPMLTRLLMANVNLLAAPPVLSNAGLIRRHRRQRRA